ncbi:hypothetical protein AX16_007998 [Volvariella volvacea WC 439]|nr:hypothetical protein AX16_007998 [Volvariella volvacea WC 439]
MSRLNYSKWDALELSDDSDIEGHPNVDKRSLIRWKQRDIHEKREARKYKISHLEAQIACNKVLLPRITEISKKLNDDSADVPPTKYFSSLVERLEKNPSKECPPGNDPNKIEHTYDGMILDLLRQVANHAKEKVSGLNLTDNEKEERLGKELATGMAEHVVRLDDTIKKDAKELEDELNEQQKKITSDDIHEGFSSKYQPPPTEPAPVPVTKNKGKEKKKETVTEFEVLNPTASDKGKSSGPPPAPAAEDDDEELDELPELTPDLEGFSRISIKQYEKSFEYIQHHRSVFAPGASDALLVAAFRAESAGQKKYAKQCVHQSLLIQYCEKLGRDGVGLFFKKMISGDARAEKVFVDDFESTYHHLVQRVQISLEEQSAGREQIQLVPENPDQSITFLVPDGPPPEDLVLEGPGTEGLDIEEVRKALQMRWDVFSGYSPAFQEALKSGELEKVNKVLGEMDVEEAEEIVNSLNMAGILSFAEGGIRDETGQAAASSS